MGARAAPLATDGAGGAGGSPLAMPPAPAQISTIRMDPMRDVARVIMANHSKSSAPVAVGVGCDGIACHAAPARRDCGVPLGVIAGVGAAFPSQTLFGRL